MNVELEKHDSVTTFWCQRTTMLLQTFSKAAIPIERIIDAP